MKPKETEKEVPGVQVSACGATACRWDDNLRCTAERATVVGGVCKTEEVR